MLLNNIDSASRAFQGLGVKKDDIVFMLCVNCPEVLYCMYALNRIGAVTEWFYPLAISAELLRQHLIENNIKFVVAVDIMFPILSLALVGTDVKQVIVLSVKDSMPLGGRILYNAQVYGITALLHMLPRKLKIRNKLKQYAENQSIAAKASYLISTQKDSRFIRYPDFIKANQHDNVINEVSYEHDRVTFIMHTGGTTGPVKRVSHTDYAINAAVYQTTLLPLNLFKGMKSLHIVPPIVAFGLENYHVERFYNMTSYLVSTYNKNEFLTLIRRHRPNLLVCVPSFLAEIRDSNPRILKDDDFSCLKVAIYGGEACPVPIEKEIDETLHNHGCTMSPCSGFGQNEEFGWFTINIAGDEKKYGCCGVPLPGNMFMIYNLDKQEEVCYGKNQKGEYQVGELLVTGPTMMKGYIGKDEPENVRALKVINGRTWIDTGDQAYIDENGRLWYVTRSKRIIRTQQGKIFVNVIEHILEQMEEIVECCVTGIPHQTNVKAAACHIVLHEHVSHDLVRRDAVIESIVSRIDAETQKTYSYYVPASYVFHSSPLPRTSFGKIDFLKLELSDLALYQGRRNDEINRIRFCQCE